MENVENKDDYGVERPTVGQAAFGANILLNPGFEDGVLSPWVNDNDFCGGCTWSAITNDAQSGVWSAEVDGNRLLLQSFSAIA